MSLKKYGTGSQQSIRKYDSQNENLHSEIKNIIVDLSLIPSIPYGLLCHIRSDPSVVKHCCACLQRSIFEDLGVMPRDVWELLLILCSSVIPD